MFLPELFAILLLLFVFFLFPPIIGCFFIIAIFGVAIFLLIFLISHLILLTCIIVFLFLFILTKKYYYYYRIPNIEKYLIYHPTTLSYNGLQCYNCNCTEVGSKGLFNHNSKHRYFFCKNCFSVLFRYKVI